MKERGNARRDIREGSGATLELALLVPTSGEVKKDTLGRIKRVRLQQDTTAEGIHTFQLNSNGFIECREDSDCPREWIDPDCTDIEDDGGKTRHCWQRKYAGSSCANANTFYYLTNNDYNDLELINGKFCTDLEYGVVTNCYTNPVRNITHIDDCWGGDCDDCGDCLVGTNMSTSRYIQVIEENKQNRKKFCEEDPFYSLDNCPENAGCACAPASDAGGVPLTHTSSVTAQELVLVDQKYGCPHEYCKRGNKCCKLVWSRRGYYVCPYHC